MRSLESTLKIKARGIIHNIQGKFEKRMVNARLDRYDPCVIQNVKPKKIENIVFVIERFALYSGGQTSILRLGTKLSNLGYQVGYVVYKRQSIAAMEEIAGKNLKGYKGTMYTCNEMGKIRADVVIASSWDTVSFVKKMHGYKMYFVQDFEPYFFSFGELFMMASKTYEQGLHMVSLGQWNKEMLLKNCKIISPIDTIEFPYEKKEYPEITRDYNAYGRKKEFVFAVYLKYYGKRFPNITQYLLKQVKDEFKKEGINLILKYYGEDKSFTCEGGVNLGVLNKKQLFELYKEADFGFVASMSNISLVPYEMLATGLPVIEFEDGTFPYFFPDNSAILTSLSYMDLYHKIKDAITNKGHLEEMNKNAKNHLSTLSWDKTAGQFNEILQGILKD